MLTDEESSTTLNVLLHLPKLRRLTVEIDARFDMDEALRQAFRNASSLDRLTLLSNRSVCLSHLPVVPNLTVLSARNCVLVSLKGLDEMRHLSVLKVLSLPASPEDVQALRSSRISHLSFHHVSDILSEMERNGLNLAIRDLVGRG